MSCHICENNICGVFYPDITKAELFRAPFPKLNRTLIMARLVEASKSVGMIHRCGQPCGTGFRVGSKCIMTAAHVLKILLGMYNSSEA